MDMVHFRDYRALAVLKFHGREHIQHCFLRTSMCPACMVLPHPGFTVLVSRAFSIGLVPRLRGTVTGGVQT